MTRPAVLLVDGDSERRKALAVGLARFAYEVVPAETAEQGLRFAEGLGPSVVVAPAEMPGFGDGTVLGRFSATDSRIERTLLLLGRSAAAAEPLPEDILYLDVSAIGHEEVVRRLRLVLVGREVGLEPDVTLEGLLGDLARAPLLEVVRSLREVEVSGTLTVADGAIALDGGEVVAARLGDAKGAKALGRMARLVAGTLRLTLGTPPAERNVELGFDELMVRTIEDMLIALPDLGLAVRLADDAPPSRRRDEQRLRSAVGEGATVGSVLDALPENDGLLAELLDGLVSRGVLTMGREKSKVVLVTDSTCDLTPALAASHRIEVMPLMIRFGSERFRDGVDIKARDFYDLIEQEHPTTEPPPAGELAELYKHLLPEQDVVSVHLSSNLSETFAHAEAAAAETVERAIQAVREDAAIEVVDSRGVSLGLGVLALLGARLAARGHGASAIAERLRSWRERVHTLFVVDTFDFLVRGGRIGRARAALGRLLGIKPILGVTRGEVDAVGRARGGRRAHPRIVDLIAQRIDPDRPMIAGVAHASAPVWADRLEKLLAERFTVAEALHADIGPVVGAHVGPGCVGCVVFQPETEETWADLAPLA